MGKELLVHPKAKAESDAAYAWYKQRSMKVAARFAKELEQAYSEISDEPDRFAAYPFGPGRYRMLRSFPYLVVYGEHSNSIVIYAVAHGHRQPGYWDDRTDEP